MANSIQMHPSWLPYLAAEFDKSYMKELKQFLLEEKQRKAIIYPHGEEYFAAFNLTPFEEVRVVILGQDPYHGPGQAHGLCFSVKPGVQLPPSLQNIFKELEADLGVPRSTKNGYLVPWAKQGVLLLNSVLTVEDGRAASHQGRGWELFTDKVIEVLNLQKSGLVFVLWGSYAQKKGAMIDRKKHMVIESPHPSPLSAHRGFFGTRPFSKINDYLVKNGHEQIRWQLD